MPQNGNPPPDDMRFMEQALDLARSSLDAREVPIGSVVVLNNEVIGRGSNRTRRDGVVTAHAEMLALSEAEKSLGDFRLDEAWIYVTVEPCMMCLGAIIQARITRIVFGAREPKFGALYSRYNLADHSTMRKINIEEGVCREASVELLQEFFNWLRSN